MDIRLVEGQYKSISSLDWHGIPPFAVITGANGAGKTQLLELIAHRAGVFVQPPGAFNPRHQSPETFNARLDCSIHLDAQNTVFLRSYWEMGDAAATTQQVRELMHEAWNARVIPTEPQALATRSTQWDTLWEALSHASGVTRFGITSPAVSVVVPMPKSLSVLESIRRRQAAISAPAAFSTALTTTRG